MSTASAGDRRYFHASPSLFAAGEVLVPPTVSGVVPNYAVGRPTTRVYMSDSLDTAEEWAMHLKHLSRHCTHQPEVYVYEVEPRGRVHSAYLDDMDITEFHAGSAVVVARVGSTDSVRR